MARRNLLHISIMGGDPKARAIHFAGLAETADDGVWFRNRLREQGLLDAFDYRSVDLPKGQALPEPESVDVVLVGGSVPSIHEGFDWQRRAMTWLERYRAQGRPLFGCCAAHQMIGLLQGGRVVSLAEGRFVGSRAVRLTPAGRRHFVFEGFDEAPCFHFGNAEHVVDLPDHARLLAAAEGFELAALDHGGGWVTVQFHPEMTAEVMVASLAGYYPEPERHFRPLPDAPRILGNFLRGCGVL